jgi:hypothetical protein
VPGSGLDGSGRHLDAPGRHLDTLRDTPLGQKVPRPGR